MSSVRGKKKKKDIPQTEAQIKASSLKADLRTSLYSLIFSKGNRSMMLQNYFGNNFSGMKPSMALATVLFMGHMSKAFAKESITITLSTDELMGDSHSEETHRKPLIIHLDKENISPEVLKRLSRTSNILIPEIPGLPEFINPKEYSDNFKVDESFTDHLMGEIMKEKGITLEKIKQNEKFSELEDLLKGIMEKEFIGKLSSIDEMKKIRSMHISNENLQEFKNTVNYTDVDVPTTTPANEPHYLSNGNSPYAHNNFTDESKLYESSAGSYKSVSVLISLMAIITLGILSFV